MKFSKFIETYKVGKGYDYDKVYGCQCVDLAKFYIDKVLGATPQSIGDAKEYWLKRNQAYIKSLFTVVKGNACKYGDVFVRDSGEHGHIGMVMSVDKDGFTAIEQNAGGCGVVKHLYHKFAKDIHFLRPINQTNLTNQPSLSAGDKVVLHTRCYCYKNTKKEAYTIKEISQFSCTEKARLKKGRELIVQSVTRKGEDVWITVKVNSLLVYLYAYNSAKDKCYINKA